MKKNKTILEIIILIGFCFLGLNGLAKAETLSRDVSATLKSSCVPGEINNTNDNMNWTCYCQKTTTTKEYKCQTGKIITDPICACCGDCTLENALDIGVNVANLILKYMGVVALLFFIIGGMMWIMSGGSQERIGAGKKMITGAIIGMIIIILAATIVRTVAKVFIEKQQQTKYLESIQSTTGVGTTDAAQ